MRLSEFALISAAYLLCFWMACAWFDDHGWRFWKW